MANFLLWRERMDYFSLESADNKCSIVTNFDTNIYKKITKLPEKLVVREGRRECNLLPLAVTTPAMYNGQHTLNLKSYVN